MQPETDRTRGHLGTFAGRYSYEEIKVGSKTGESLIAFDEEALQFVVIKRPSPTEPNADARRASIADLAREEAVLRTPGLGDHPAVCRLLDAGVADGRDGGYRYLVLERARGTPVPPLAERYYRQGQPLPPRLYLDIMRQLLALLAVAHRLGVVYNDVKAEHLFWEEKTAQLKVIDWGNAQFAAATTGLTPADDVFQCGELLYEFIMLSKYGRSGLKDWVAAGRLLWEPPGAGSQLKRLVAKALDPIPTERYATAAEMADDLLAYYNVCERRIRESRAAADGAVRAGDLVALRDSDAAMQALLAYDPSDTEAATLLSTIRRRRRQLPEWGPATAAVAGKPQASLPAPSGDAVHAPPPASETFSTPAPTLRREPSVAAAEDLSPPPNLPARAKRIRKRRARRTTGPPLWIGAGIVVSLTIVVGLVVAGLFTRERRASGGTAVTAVTPAAPAVPLPITPLAVGSPSLVGEATQDSCSQMAQAEQAGRWDEVLAQVALAAGQPPAGCGGRSWADIEAHARLHQECAAVRAGRNPALINRLIVQYGTADITVECGFDPASLLPTPTSEPVAINLLALLAGKRTGLSVSCDSSPCPALYLDESQHWVFSNFYDYSEAYLPLGGSFQIGATGRPWRESIRAFSISFMIAATEPNSFPYRSEIAVEMSSARQTARLVLTSVPPLSAAAAVVITGQQASVCDLGAASPYVIVRADGSGEPHTLTASWDPAGQLGFYVDGQPVCQSTIPFLDPPQPALYLSGRGATLGVTAMTVVLSQP